MITFSDYYPFGMPMPLRNSLSDYRYAYQGQEKDPETGKEAFELRLWDARIGRWLTTDPYREFYSPYLGMGNNPISLTDPDGGCTTCDPPNDEPTTTTLVGFDETFGGGAINQLDTTFISNHKSVASTAFSTYWRLGDRGVPEGSFGADVRDIASGMIRETLLNVAGGGILEAYSFASRANLAKTLTKFNNNLKVLWATRTVNPNAVLKAEQGFVQYSQPIYSALARAPKGGTFIGPKPYPAGSILPFPRIQFGRGAFNLPQNYAPLNSRLPAAYGENLSRFGKWILTGLGAASVAAKIHKENHKK